MAQSLASLPAHSQAPGGAETGVFRSQMPEKSPVIGLKPTSPEVQKVQTRAEQLRAWKLENKTPKEVLQRNIITESLTPAEQAQLDKVDPILAKEAKAFDTYSSVVDEARRTNRTIEDVCMARKIDKAFVFDNNQKVVIDKMVTVDYVTQKIPGFSGMNPGEQRAAAEAYVASHPGVRELYLAELKGIAAKAATLPESQSEAATKQQAEAVAQLQGERAAQAKSIKDKLGDPLGNNIKKDVVEKAIAGSKTVEDAEMKLLDAVLEKNNIPPARYNAHQERQRMQALESEFQEVHKKGDHAKENFDKNGYLNGNDTDPKVIEYKKLQARNPDPNVPISLTLPEQQTVKAIEDALFGEVRYIRGVPQAVGGVKDELKQIQDSLKAEKTLKENTPATSTEASPEKAALQKNMAEAMEKSIEQALSRDYDELQAIKDRKVQAEAEDAPAREKRAILAVNEAQKQHGVHTGIKGEEIDGKSVEGKKVINRTEIGNDVRRLAQEGEEGLKRIELRNLTEGSDPIISLTDADGNPLMVTINGKSEKATWETVDMSRLSKVDQALLDKMHATQGNRLAEQILVDYFVARKPPMDRWNPLSGWKDIKMIGQPEDLKLLKAQEADLVKFIGKDNIQAFFKSSREYGTIKQALEDMVKNPDSHGNIMMALLALLAAGGGLRKKKREDFV